MEDLKILLQKYIVHVQQVEGSDSIHLLNDGIASSIHFTEQEVKTLKELQVPNEF